MTAKKDLRWQLGLGAGLIGLSAAVYFIHFLIFHDAHHIFIYLIGDIGFVFIEVLLVTIVIHSLLAYREKMGMLNKLNMVIGVFFNEAGTDLLKSLSGFDRQSDKLITRLSVSRNWSLKEFSSQIKSLSSYKPEIDAGLSSLAELKSLLIEKRRFLLNMMENPNLLEHESFTDLLWGIFHLTEELIYREHPDKVHGKDKEHIEGDMQRAYKKIVVGWVDYLSHLKKSYPYLFSLAVRTNPFDPAAKVELE